MNRQWESIKYTWGQLGVFCDSMTEEIHRVRLWDQPYGTSPTGPARGVVEEPAGCGEERTLLSAGSEI